MSFKFFLIGSALLFCMMGSSGYATPFTLTITGIQNDKGVVRASLYTSESAYDKRSKEDAYKIAALPIQNHQAVWNIDLPDGNYALLFFHDEDNDKIFKKNMLGIPQEGYGFSGTSQDKKPSFKDALFPVDASHTTMTVQMKYWN